MISPRRRWLLQLRFIAATLGWWYICEIYCETLKLSRLSRNEGFQGTWRWLPWNLHNGHAPPSTLPLDQLLLPSHIFTKTLSNILLSRLPNIFSLSRQLQLLRKWRNANLGLWKVSGKKLSLQPLACFHPPSHPSRHPTTRGITFGIYLPGFQSNAKKSFPLCWTPQV